jgi:glycerol-3-phosphate O-acyltransferase
MTWQESRGLPNQVSYLFKNSGAFFIKRTGLRFPKIYRAYLSEYIDYILQSGKNIEFFIEGTRSRTGKVVPPKFGILKYIFESFQSKNIANAIVVPLTINYENVIEVGQLLNEWLGRSKKKESLGQLIGALSVLRHDFGDIFVKVGKPVSLTTFVAKNEGMTFDSQLNALGEEIAQQLQRNTIVMNTCLISCLFLLAKSDLPFVRFFRQMETLQECVTALGGKLNKNCEDELVLRSCRYFDFLEVDQGRKVVLFKAKSNTFHTFKMLYYRNFVFHFFVRDALVVAILKGSSSLTLRVSEIERTFAAVAGVLREESFRLGQEDSTLLDFLKHNCLGIYEVSGSQGNEQARLLCEEERLSFICDLVLSFIRPILDSYIQTFDIVAELMTNGVEEVSTVQLEGRIFSALHRMGKDGAVESIESCSMNFIRNALRVLQVT